jgi:hypothetical protein
MAVAAAAARQEGSSWERRLPTGRATIPPASRRQGTEADPGRIWRFASVDRTRWFRGRIFTEIFQRDASGRVNFGLLARGRKIHILRAPFPQITRTA